VVLVSVPPSLERKPRQPQAGKADPAVQGLPGLFLCDRQGIYLFTGIPRVFRHAGTGRNTKDSSGFRADWFSTVKEDGGAAPGKAVIAPGAGLEQIDGFVSSLRGEPLVHLSVSNLDSPVEWFFVCLGLKRQGWRAYRGCGRHQCGACLLSR